MTSRAVFGFPRRRAAEQAYEALCAAGFAPSDLSLFVHAPPLRPRAMDTAADHAADVGGAAGAELGGVGGALAGLGLLSAPGLGPLLAVGPLAAALTGAIAGGAVGGFAGSLAGLGLGEAEAMASEAHLKAGRSILVAACGARCDEAERIARAAGGTRVDAP